VKLYTLGLCEIYSRFNISQTIYQGDYDGPGLQLELE